jgi:hypothetical protein
MLDHWASCAEENVGWCLLCDGPIRTAEDLIPETNTQPAILTATAIWIASMCFRWHPAGDERVESQPTQLGPNAITAVYLGQWGFAVPYIQYTAGLLA